MKVAQRTTLFVVYIGEETNIIRNQEVIEMKKKHLFMILPMGFALLLMACGSPYDSEAPSEEAAADQERVVTEDNECIVIDGNISMDDFFDNNHDELMNEYLGNLDAFFNGRIDNYAGIFYAGSGNYVILFADALENWQTPELLEGVRFRVCRVEHSYSELAEIGTQIDNNYAATSAQITGWGIGTLENIVIVYLAEVTDEAIQDFRENVSDSPLIEFKEGSFDVEELDE